jgi:hypothetical protein
MNLDCDDDQPPRRPSVFKQRIQAQRQATRVPVAPPVVSPPPEEEAERRAVRSAHERCVFTVCTPAVYGAIHFNNEHVMITYVGDTTKVCGSFRYVTTEGDDGVCIVVDASRTQFDSMCIWVLGRDVTLELRTPGAVRRTRYRNETPERLKEK